MLVNLNIRNIILIKELDIEFNAGLCVLTGETGAGKSILLNSLKLILGDKFDIKLIRSGEEKASVIATFNNSPILNILLEKLGIDGDEKLIIKRQISLDGKSRAFINGESVSIKILKNFGENLVEIYGQHKSRGLMDNSTHIILLDKYGKHNFLLESVNYSYKTWIEAKNAVRILQNKLKKVREDREYLEYSLDELRKLDPQIGEEEKLSDDRLQMMQYEKLTATINDAMNFFCGHKAASIQLRDAQNLMIRSTIKDAAEKFSPAIEALEKALIEINEAENSLQHLGQNSEYNELELENTEERLFAIKAIARKHNVSPDKLPRFLEEIEEKLTALNLGEDNLAQFIQNEKDARIKYIEDAEKLHNARRKTAKNLQNYLHIELNNLKMGATVFNVNIAQKLEKYWNESGVDKVFFEASTNKGSALGAISEIASGGELSRFMLALAVVLGGTGTASTLIFDEIDAGTGGAVAESIGKRLRKLGESAQVLVVTHLPQVAAQGMQHLFIEKNEENEQTITNICNLSENEKYEEIARMISGEIITSEARIAAKKLLSL